MTDIIIGILLGILFTLVFLYVYWTWGTRNKVIIKDPSVDIVCKLKCPDCGSTDFEFSEVSDLSWIQGEDRFCICNHCGRRFGDGK